MLLLATLFVNVCAAFLTCPSNVTLGASAQVQVNAGADTVQLFLTGSAFFLAGFMAQNATVTGSQVLQITNFQVEQVDVLAVSNETSTNCSIFFQTVPPVFLWEKNIAPDPPLQTLRQLIAVDPIGNAFTVFFNNASVDFLQKHTLDSMLAWTVLLPGTPHQIASQSDKVVVALGTQVLMYESESGNFSQNIDFDAQPFIAAVDLTVDQAFLHVTGTFQNWTHRGTNYLNPFLIKMSLDGEVVWVVSETARSSEPLALSVGPSGEVGLQGAFTNQLTLNSTNYYYSGSDPSSSFIILFSPNGTVNWFNTTVNLPNTYHLLGRKLIIDSFGHVHTLFGNNLSNWLWDLAEFSPMGQFLHLYSFRGPDDMSLREVDFVTLPNEAGVLVCVSATGTLSALDSGGSPGIVNVSLLDRRLGFLIRLGYPKYSHAWRGVIDSDRESAVRSCAADKRGRIFAVGRYRGITQFGQLPPVSGSTEIEAVQFLAVLSQNQSFPVGASTLVSGDEDTFIPINFGIVNSSTFTTFQIRLETYPSRGTLHASIGGPAIVGVNQLVGTTVFFLPLLDQFSGEDIFDTFTYRVFSNGLLSLDPYTVKMIVRAVNDPPIALSQNITISQGQGFFISLTANQTWGENDDLQLYLASTCAFGRGDLFGPSDLQNPLIPPVLVGKTIYYKPPRALYGPDVCTFQFFASDSLLNSSMATVAISLLFVNTPPDVSNSTIRVASSNAELIIQLQANDIDGDPFSLKVISLPSTGELIQFDTRQRVSESDFVTDGMERVIYIPPNTTLPLGSIFAQFSFVALTIGCPQTSVSATVSINYYVVCDVGTEQSVDGVHCSPCAPGYGKSDPGSDVRCTICPVGFFATANGVCLQCPPGAICDVKGLDVSQMNLLEGYWRSSNASMEVFSCPQPQLCLGGVSGCPEFRTGAFCGRCEDGYTSVGTSCSLCSPNTGLVVLVAILVFLLAVLAAFRLSREGRNDDSTNAGLGILFYWLQVCALLFGITSNKARVETYSSWLDITNLQATTPLQGLCAIPDLPEATFLLRLLVPTAWAVILVVLLQLLAIFRRKTPLRQLFPKLILQFFTMGYAGLSQTILRYFQCVHEGPYYVVFTQPGIHCDSSNYKGILVLFCIAFLLVPAPLFMWLFFAKNHKLVVEGDKGFAARWGPLLAPYHLHAYWWGAYILCRRTLLIILDVAFEQFGPKMLALGLSNLLFVFLHHHFNPLKDPAMNKLEYVTLYLVLVLNLALGITPETVAAWAVFPLVIAPLVAIVAWFVYRAYKLKRGEQSSASTSTDKLEMQQQA